MGGEEGLVCVGGGGGAAQSLSEAGRGGGREGEVKAASAAPPATLEPQVHKHRSWSLVHPGYTLPRARVLQHCTP